MAEDIDLLNNQIRDTYFEFKPPNGRQDRLTGTVATILVRLERRERIERKLRDWASDRAIERSTSGKMTSPSKSRRGHRRSTATRGGAGRGEVAANPAGLDWLLKRWRLLETVKPGRWPDEQRALAGRLVGGDPESEVDPTRPGFAVEQVAQLEARRTRVAEADAILRGLVEADPSDDAVPGLAQLRRYAWSPHRQVRWYVDQFQVKYPGKPRDDPHGKPVCFGVSMDPFATQPSASNLAQSVGSS